MKNRIEELIRAGFEKAIVNYNSTYCTKIYIDFEGELSSIKVPNRLWKSCYMDKVICTIPNMRNLFDYEKCGSIKDNLSKEQYEEVLKLHSEDEEGSIEESIKVLEKENISFLYWYKYFEEAMQKHISNFLNDLHIQIDNELNVKLEYKGELLKNKINE